MGEKIQSFCNNVSVLFTVHTACVYDMYQCYGIRVYRYDIQVYSYAGIQLIY